MTQLGRNGWVRALACALALAAGGSVWAQPAPLATAPQPATPAPAAPDTSGEGALHAPAGAADCIWAEVPQEIRDRVTAARSIDVIADAIRRLSSTREDRASLAHHCGAPADAIDPAGIVQQAVEARTMEIWTENQLEGAYGVGLDRLADAWGAASADERAALADWFARGFDTETAPQPALSAFAGRVGLAGADATALVGYYAGARALFEQLGGAG